MTVERTQMGHQTRYEIRDGGVLLCALTYGSAVIEPAAWKVFLPGPGGTEDLYGTERFLVPTASLLRAWLTPIVGDDRAGALVGAVDADPPATSGWSQARERS
jgi:hypothetical protein